MKVWNYVYVAITMIIVFQFMGMPSGHEGVLDFVNVEFDSTTNAVTSFDIQLGDLLLYFLTSVETLVGVGIAIGLFASGKSDIAIKAGIATAVLSSFVSILYFPLTNAMELKQPAWMVGILAVIFIPFSVLYIFALWEYIIGGND